MKIAKQKELITAGMTGSNVGKLGMHSLYRLNVPSEHTPRIQEAGDTSVDIEAGKKAGCKTALITQSVELTSVAEKPDLLAQSLMELTQRLLFSS
jgi:phosphoglycolate phosphatase-like HAD superfamily hydrolase